MPEDKVVRLGTDNIPCVCLGAAGSDIVGPYSIVEYDDIYPSKGRE